MADDVRVPRELVERIDVALQRHRDRHAPMRVPVDPTDSDVVQAELRAMLAAAPSPAAPAESAGQRVSVPSAEFDMSPEGRDRMLRRGLTQEHYDKVDAYLRNTAAPTQEGKT